MSAFLYAADKGYIDVIRIYLHHLQDEKTIIDVMTTPNQDLLNALVASGDHGHLDVLKLLVKQFTDEKKTQGVTLPNHRRSYTFHAGL